MWSQQAQSTLCITPSLNIDPTHHYSTTASVGSLPSTANIGSGDGSATTMGALASIATRENFPSRNGMLATTPLVGCQGLWPGNVSLSAGAISSNAESSDTSINTSDVERSTDVDMDEGRMADTADEDSEPKAKTGASRGPVLPMDYEGEVAKLKARLIAKGADEQVVELCDAIFKNGVTIEALEERMTREQCDELGVRDGKQFRMFLKLVGGAHGGVTGRHRCGLCSPGKEYKNHRDALRHLLKDHFGLSFKCERWLVSLMTRELVLTELESIHRCFTRAELTRHIKIKHSVFIDN